MSKRPSTAALPPAKRLAPIFAMGKASTSAPPPTTGTFDHTAPPTMIHYHHLDPLASTSEPSKDPVTIIMYDLDGTLIRPKDGRRFPKDAEDWQWWHGGVPSHLKKMAKAGNHIVVFSNQLMETEKKKRTWKGKLPLIAARIDDVPIRVLAATQRDAFRKPHTGMFDYLVQLYEEKGWKIDREKSLYVGDAAGRKGDHSNTDFTMALNAGLNFETPEEHFLGMGPKYPNPPAAFRPTAMKDYGNLPPIVPSNTPIAREQAEIVLFIGPPAAGKTSFYRRHFDTYEHINQDTLRTRDACIRAARRAADEGRAIVVDNQNRDKGTRALWVNLAKELKLPIRAFHFKVPVDLAEHNSLYRGMYAPTGEPSREVLPKQAFISFSNAYDAPLKNEGFEEVRTVNFVWEGTAEQFKLWDRYLLSK